MDRKALLEQRTRLGRQRDAELKACRANWRRRIDAIDQRLREAGTNSNSSQSDPHPQAFAEVLDELIEHDRKQGVMELVRRALEDCEGMFTARTLVGLINKDKPSFLSERDVSNPLWRLRKLGEIKIVENGKGRKPHV